MSVQDIESAIAQLPQSELAEFLAETWDKQIEEDVQAGRLDALFQQVDQEFESGQYQPL